MARPRIWEDPEEFDRAVEVYFSTPELAPHTWTGLARALGFESRQSLEDYKTKDGFSYPIKKALLRIEEIYEQALFNKNPSGPIFALKNFGWRDRQEVEQKHSGGISINWNDPKLRHTDDKGGTGELPGI